MSIIKISELPVASSPVSPSDVLPVVQDGITKKAGVDQLGFIAAGTGANPRTIQNKLRDIVSVKDFGAVGDGVADDTNAINNAIAAVGDGGALYFPEGTYRTTSTINLRRRIVDAEEATISGDHSNIVVILGNNSAASNGPEQRMNIVTRVGGVTSTPTVRIMGVKGQYISVQFSEYVQLYADTDDPTTTSIAYSSFWFKFVRKIELTANFNTTGSQVQWINENQFYLNRTNELIVNGTYGHNNNHFWAGTFEFNASITFNVGRSNWVHNVRFENSATVTFDAGVNDCVVINSWVSSGHRYPTTGVTVVNNGYMCSYVSAYDAYYPNTSYIGFSYETLKRSGLGYNVQGVSNVTINPTNLTVGPNETFYESPIFPVDGRENTIGIVSAFNASTGIKIKIDGYDSSKNLITPADDQVFYSGIGNQQFQQVAPASSNFEAIRFYILDPNCAFIKVSVRNSSNSAITFDAFQFSLRANTTDLKQRQAAYLFPATEAFNNEIDGTLIFNTASVDAATKVLTKNLVLDDNTAATFLTIDLPAMNSDLDFTNIGIEIAYVAYANRRTSSRVSRSTYGKVYLAIDRYWEDASAAPVTITLVDTDEELANSTGTFTITWAASVTAGGTDESAKTIEVTVLVDNPSSNTIRQGVVGQVTAYVYNTEANASDIVLS